MPALVEDIGNLLILVVSTPVEEDGVVVVDGAATGEDTRIIVIIKVLLLRFMPFGQTVQQLAGRSRYVYLDLHVFHDVRDL